MKLEQKSFDSNFSKTLIFDPLNCDNMSDFGKNISFCETKMVSIFYLKPPLIRGGFTQFWRFFFSEKFQCLKMTQFWPKFTICWASAELSWDGFCSVGLEWAGLGWHGLGCAGFS